MGLKDYDVDLLNERVIPLLMPQEVKAHGQELVLFLLLLGIPCLM